MKAPRSQLALSVVVCLLALVALARSQVPAAPVRPLRAASVAPRSAAVRALRQGEAIDLNRASAADLTMLPGVGPKLAQRIVDERTRRHGFASLDELREVKGIGPAKQRQLLPLLRLEVVKPAGGEADGQVQRLARPVAQHEGRAGAQAEHQLAPH